MHTLVLQNIVMTNLMELYRRNIWALKLKKSFQTVKRDWTDIWKSIINSDIDIDIKCGINTGNVLVGLTGSIERDQFSVIGTHVNLASRLEGIAQNDQVVISSYTLAEN